MTFEQWWSENWKPVSGPDVLNLAFKEIAERAWNASKQAAKVEEPTMPFTLAAQGRRPK